MRSRGVCKGVAGAGRVSGKVVVVEPDTAAIATELGERGVGMQTPVASHAGAARSTACAVGGVLPGSISAASGGEVLVRGSISATGESVCEAASELCEPLSRDVPPASASSRSSCTASVEGSSASSAASSSGARAGDSEPESATGLGIGVFSCESDSGDASGSFLKLRLVSFTAFVSVRIASFNFCPGEPLVWLKGRGLVRGRCTLPLDVDSGGRL
mmetsp:Transcript_69725/g.123409  ORF Transcript_69725/g.123409 Transcript_69725/m.123409 type:complete len:216 (+) Transcript_69725:1659-2306(+)